VLLIIDNKGELIAENHVPSLLIEAGKETVFDNRNILTEEGVVGEIIPGCSVTFSLYELLQHPISKLCNYVKLVGFRVAINRNFKVTAYSTYTAPGGTHKYDTATYEFKFRWFHEQDEVGPVKVELSPPAYIRKRTKGN